MGYNFVADIMFLSSIRLAVAGYQICKISWNSEKIRT